jgi:hypothetical protein
LLSLLVDPFAKEEDRDIRSYRFNPGMKRHIIQSSS